MSIERALVSYFSGEANEYEQRRIEEWLKESDDNRREFELLELAWKSRPLKKTYINQDEKREKIWNEFISDSSKSRNFFNYNFIVKSAAVLLFFSAFAFLIIRFPNQMNQGESIAKKEVITKTNPKGVKSTIRLPDGSNVILNSESTISYSFAGDDSLRTIELDGEAFFQVKEDQDRPFIVKAENVIAKVLGTEFNVRAFPNEEIEVALLEGKIQVVTESGETNIDSIILHPGQAVRVLDTRKIHEMNIPDTKEKIGWKDGIIYFKNNSMDEVLTSLGRWYGVEFNFANEPVSKWNYTAEFKDDYLEVILESMSYSLHFDYKIRNKKVEIVFN